MTEETVRWHNMRFALQTKWIRETQNPVVSGYPKPGDIITLRNHRLMSDGEYLVLSVIEWEPAYTPGHNGRDIRLSIVDDHGISYRELNGQNILDAIV